jgi:hypothetical protein
MVDENHNGAGGVQISILRKSLIVSSVILSILAIFGPQIFTNPFVLELCKTVRAALLGLDDGIPHQ